MGNNVRLVANVLSPYHYLSAHSKTIGLNYEIIKKALEFGGYTLDMEVKDDINANDETCEFKKVDGIVQIRENNKSALDSNLSDLIIISEVEFITNKFNLNSLKPEELEMKNLTLGFVENYEYPEATNIVPKNHKLQYKSYDKLVEDIYCNKIDLGLIDSRVKSYIKGKDKYKSIVTIPNLKFNTYFYILFSKENIDLKHNFNIGLKKLIDTNQYSEILKYWSFEQRLLEV